MPYDTIEITETEARNILRDNRIERGMEDHRSCIEIAQKFGLVPTSGEIEINPVAEQQRIGQVYNLTANVQPMRVPYFVR